MLVQTLAQRGRQMGVILAVGQRVDVGYFLEERGSVVYPSTHNIVVCVRVVDGVKSLVLPKSTWMTTWCVQMPSLK